MNDKVEVRISYQQPKLKDLQGKIRHAEGEVAKLEREAKKLGWRGNDARNQYAASLGTWGSGASQKQADALDKVHTNAEKLDAKQLDLPSRRRSSTSSRPRCPTRSRNRFAKGPDRGAPCPS